MPVITDLFKRQVTQDLFDDFSDSASNSYYIGIGRSEGWGDSADTATVPRNTAQDVRNARLSLQSAKVVSDVSFVIPRRQWATGLIYYAYDDNNVGYNPDQPFYVINSNQEIYICIRQGKTADGLPRASDQQPTGNTTGTPFTLSDGYTWKFLYSIGALRASKFLSSSYMPVKKVLFTDSDSPAEDLQQEIVQDNAIDGQVIGYEVIEGGSGYSPSNPPPVTITGNGTGATAYAIVAGEEVVEVRVKEDSAGNSGNSYLGSGYEYASATISGGGGTGATLRPVLGPKGGLGFDPRNDLKSSALMFNTKISGDEDSDFTIGTDIYRQVSLLKNVLQYDSVAPLTDRTGIALKRITHNGAGWDAISILKQQVTNGQGAVAYIDKTNGTNTFWFHQTEETGFEEFSVSDEISIVGNSEKTGTITAINNGDFDPMSGDLLYIDNRSAVDRNNGQDDDLKIVISL